MVAKRSSLSEGVSAGLRNFNLTKKRGINQQEVISIVFQPGCYVAVSSSPAFSSARYFYVVSHTEYKFYPTMKTFNVNLKILNRRW